MPWCSAFPAAAWWSRPRWRHTRTAARRGGRAQARSALPGRVRRGRHRGRGAGRAYRRRSHGRCHAGAAGGRRGAERVELDRRLRAFPRSSGDLGGRTAIVVDDGVATGATAEAACLRAAGRRHRSASCSRCRWPRTIGPRIGGRRRVRLPPPRARVLGRRAVLRRLHPDRGRGGRAAAVARPPLSLSKVPELVEGISRRELRAACRDRRRRCASARLWKSLIEKSAPSRSCTSSRSCSQMRCPTL